MTGKSCGSSGTGLSASLPPPHFPAEPSSGIQVWPKFPFAPVCVEDLVEKHSQQNESDFGGFSSTRHWTATIWLMMIILLLFLQKQNLALSVYLFGIGTLLTGLGSKKRTHVIMFSP